jgi:tetratricopeptide (TPR) repeat protein
VRPNLNSDGEGVVTPIDPNEFIRAVQPLLERNDVNGLPKLLHSRWTCDQIRSLLHSDHLDAKKVALLAIGMVGDARVVPELAVELKHPDKLVNELAEHALWMVWFRSGTPRANHELARGAQAIERRDFDHAIKHFNRAIEASPDFAEPYNQRAIANYLRERYEESIGDCQKAVERMPFHFGALAGLGHSQAHLGRVAEAIASYQRALEVNPHLDCIRESVEHLRAAQAAAQR